MTISDDEKRTRNKLFAMYRGDFGLELVEPARTILTQLDRPTMPGPNDFSDDLALELASEYSLTPNNVRAIYRRIHDWRTKPAEPPSVKDAALALNAAVDAMWNNCKPPTPDHYVKVVCAAQQDLKRAMEADHD